MVGLVHHQQLEPARAVLLVDLDPELAARAALGELALQLAAQAERRARAGLADIEDGALGVGDLIDAELARQAALGAVACKIHPVHGGFEASDRMLYPAYAWAQEHGLPVIVHCGTSTFAGSANAYAVPALLEPVFRDFPGLTVVLAHGGRGW